MHYHMTRKLLLYTFLPLLFAVTGGQVLAQSNPIFISHGRVEFQRSVNVYAQMQQAMDEGDESWVDLMKKMSSHFRTSYFDLYFTGNKSLYKPGRESDDKQSNFFFWQPPAQDNTVFSDLEAKKGISRKNVFEQGFLVEDSLRPIKWKITDETRNIAGFNCRRANAIIMDSIYVVAFYTDEILAEGGPESFTGLPGMILGVSLPHEHISWFATKVESVNVSEAQVAPPIKGKKVNNTALLQSIQPSMKDWGKSGRQYIQTIML